MALDKFDIEKFRIRPGKAKLKQRKTLIDLFYRSDDEYESILSDTRKKIRDIQDVFFGDGRFSLLLIFQGMDTSGKDGVIKHVMSCMNPQGVSVTSFGVPSSEELLQDFIRRAHMRIPTRGKVAVFNRSYYEEVLATKVQPEFLERQKLPPIKSKSDLWEGRYEDISNFESYLARQGFRILKFFLQISKSEQKDRLLSRIDDPKKNWKFDPNDLDARSLWAPYQQAYEECLSRTSTKESPWFAIPADDKKNARMIVAQILLEHLQKLPVRYPPVSAKQKRKLLGLRRQLG